MVPSTLASVLFGDDAFLDDGLFLKSSVKVFCDAIVVNTWHRYRKSLSREAKTISSQREQLKCAWAGTSTVLFRLLNLISVEFTAEGAKVPIKRLNQYLALARKQLTLLHQYDDQTSTQEVDGMVSMLKALLAEARNDESNTALRNSESAIFTLLMY